MRPEAVARQACFAAALAGAAPGERPSRPPCACLRCRRSRWWSPHRRAAGQSRACGSGATQEGARAVNRSEERGLQRCARALSRTLMIAMHRSAPSTALMGAHVLPTLTSKSCRLMVGAAARTMVAHVLWRHARAENSGLLNGRSRRGGGAQVPCEQCQLCAACRHRCWH